MGIIFLKSKITKILLLLLIIVTCFILIGFKPWNSVAVSQENKPVQLSNSVAPLLLNTGMVKVQKAEVSIILWIEDDTIPIEAWKQLPIPDWRWSYKEHRTNDGKNIITLTGHQVINKNQENMIYTWYTTMAPVLAKVGVKAYLDERVPESIDISAYLSKSNILPSQWFLLDNLVSIAGYESNLDMSVMAGQDKINIQLLSRGEKTDGHTVLAIPVLLKEF